MQPASTVGNESQKNILRKDSSCVICIAIENGITPDALLDKFGATRVWGWQAEHEKHKEGTN